ncbi:hypothetical protein BC936DRAFT_139797 [Jimgerdemannia flammicorona]|uniref:Uncharacterized protein n=1 Tax=Jimgerdemannia flammicorona TaxID=994334 RepID=A0A433B986_9FUNG|nr:hypothetical protein BC936DRAFT_139797 [Jimgerdemannia flammicorona]
MLGTALVSTTGAASVVIGFCGVSWSITMWAPFSLLGEFIARSEVANPEVPRGLGIHAQGQVSRVSLAAGTQGTGHDGGMYTLVETVVDEEYEMAGGTGVRVVEGGGVEVLGNGNGNGSGVVHHHHRDVLDDEDEHRHMIAKDPLSKHDDDHTGSPATSAGILLGIHNMYIVLPQFLVTFLSSILFRVLEPDTASAPASEEMGEVAAGADTIGVVLRFGGVMAGVAAVLAWSLSRQV